MSDNGKYNILFNLYKVLNSKPKLYIMVYYYLIQIPLERILFYRNYRSLIISDVLFFAWVGFFMGQLTL